MSTEDKNAPQTLKRKNEFDGKMKVVSEFLSILEQEKFRLVNFKKFDPKNYIGVIYNDQLMSYDSLSMNVHNFRRGDLTENLEVTKGKEAQPEYHGYGLTKNKNPDKVDVVTRELKKDIKELGLARYEEKNVKRIVICLTDEEQKLEKSMLKYANSENQISFSEIQKEIDTIMKNGKKKYIGHEVDRIFHSEGNIIYQGGRLWTLYPNKNAKWNYLLLLLDVSDDTIEFFPLMKYNSGSNWFIDEIINKYQTRSERWKGYLEEQETDRKTEFQKHLAPYESSAKFDFPVVKVEKKTTVDKKPTDLQIKSISLEQMMSKDFVIVIGNVIKKATELKQKISSNKSIEITIRTDSFIITFDEEKNLKAFIERHDKFQQEKKQQDLLQFLHGSPVESNYEKEIVLEAIKHVGFSLEKANVEIRSDKAFILEAVKYNGLLLEYAIDDLKNDKEIVLEAVKQDGRAFKFASQVLQDDKEFVLEVEKIIKRQKQIDDMSLLQEFKNTIQHLKEMFTVDLDISYDDGINWKAFKKMERWNRFYKLKTTDNDGKIQVGTIPEIHTTAPFQKKGMKTKLVGNEIEYCAIPIYFVYGDDELDIQKKVKSIIDKSEDGAYIGDSRHVSDWEVGDILFQGAHLWSLKGEDGNYYVFVMEGYYNVSDKVDDEYLWFSFANEFHDKDFHDDYVQLMNHKFANFDKTTREKNDGLFEVELTVLDADDNERE